MKLIKSFFPDYFSLADRRGVLMGILLSLIAFIFLYKTPAPSRNEVKKPIAQLESFSNNVRYKDSDSASFYNAVAGEIFQNSDEIITGEKSEAVIRFPNSKTTLKISSSSLIKIEANENGETIELKDGGVEIALQKDQIISLNSKKESHMIKASLKKSAVKIFYNSGELHLFTSDKGVKIKNSKGESELAFNQNSVLKSVPTKTALPESAKSPSALKNNKISNEKIYIAHDKRLHSNDILETNTENKDQLDNDDFVKDFKQKELSFRFKVGLSILLTFFFLLACF